MKLVFNVPLGLDIGRPLKREPVSTGTAVALTAANIAANAGAAGLSANAASANSHHGRIYARWALHRQEEENERARQFQMSESQKAREWEEMMYKQYNSPSAMMRQYREAGLNPYLAGQDGVGSPMSGSAPMSSAGASGLSPTTPPQFMPDFSALSRIGQDVTNAFGVSSQIANQQSLTLKNQLEALDFSYQHFGPETTKKLMEDLKFSLRDNMGLSNYNQQIIGEIMKKNQETYKLQVESGYIENFQKPEADAHIKVLNKTIDQMEAQIQVLNSQHDLNAKSMYVLGSEIAKNMAQAGLFSTQASNMSALFKYVEGSAAMALGTQGMQFLDELANFTANSDLRQWLMTDIAKKYRKAIGLTDSKNNPVMSLMQGFTNSIPASAWRSPMKPPQYNISHDWNTYVYPNQSP